MISGWMQGEGESAEFASHVNTEPLTTTALENRSGRTNFIVSGEKKTSHGPQRDDTPALSAPLPSRPPTDTKYVKKGCLLGQCHNR